MGDHQYNQPQLPDKLYFKVGEVSEITGVPTYVLRFWETEFAKINPKRTPSGQRLYRKNDVELILKIKFLLYKKKYTIQGAKQHLKSPSHPKNRNEFNALLKEIRKELESIRMIVD
ncbi:MAG: MerR family transcriptional regulator [Deltaproteobacteria bacterium]|nr:MerR family transcriptional regulator [Deltaproteobacteria bacterium]